MNKEDASKLDDDSVVRLIIESRDSIYFEIIYDRYAKRVFNKCLSFVHDDSLAEDLSHDILLKIYLNLKGFKFQSKFSTWVYSLTYNYCIDHIKKIKRQKIQDEQFQQESNESWDSNESEVLQIQSDRLKEIMDYLNPDEKAILLMKYQDDISVREIQEALNLSESATKMRLKRSREKILKLYKDRYSHNII